MSSIMSRLLISAVLCAPVVAFAQEGEPGRVTHEAAGDSERAEGSGTEHHPDQAHEEEHDPTKHFNFFNFSFRGKDEFGGKFGDGQMVDAHTGEVVKEEGKAAPEEPMSAPFVLMLLNFGLLLLILAKYGGPAARKLAKERHDQIKTALDEAAKLREQAQQKLAEYETRIKDVDSEVKKLVDGIRADAEADKKRILEAAAVQAAHMKRDAELRIAAEIQMARTQLQREVTAAAATATEKLLKEKVTADDQNKLVSTFITNVQTGRKEAR
jgi:F-type H+-transporting ATPase subunit b